jgi:hypothetical protein
MDFGLAIKLSFEIRNKSDVIQSLSGDLKAYFENKKSGNDIKNYTIGIVCVSSTFDQFYKKEIKPKYTKGIKVISQDGIPFTLEDNFEYSIKIDFEGFKNADDQESKNILAKHILASLVVFEKMKSKINDFDMVSFKADLEDYFKSQKLNSY